MNIRKRTGEVVPFQEEKILNAMKKAFSGQAQELDDRVLDEMLSVVLKRLPENGGLTVERVQDEVERVLMECGHYEVAKAYILYREKRAALRKALREEYQGITTIIIAQRVSSILHADHILVLEEGKELGYGTHQELLRSCPVYQDIAHSQMGYSQDGALEAREKEVV